jgi:hypothetical protein
VILHGDHDRVRRASFPIGLEAHPIVEFQGQRRQKYGEVRIAELQDGRFSKLGASSTKRGYLHGHANSNSLRKKARQLLRTT